MVGAAREVADGKACASAARAVAMARAMEDGVPPRAAAAAAKAKAKAKVVVEMEKAVSLEGVRPPEMYGGSMALAAGAAPRAQAGQRVTTTLRRQAYPRRHSLPGLGSYLLTVLPAPSSGRDHPRPKATQQLSLA